VVGCYYFLSSRQLQLPPQPYHHTKARTKLYCLVREARRWE